MYNKPTSELKTDKISKKKNCNIYVIPVFDRIDFGILL